MERYKAKRHEIQSLQQNLTNLERTLSSVASEEATKQQSVRIIEAKISALERDVKDQEAKRDRAFKSAVFSNKQMRRGSMDTESAGQKNGGTISSTDELDFRIRECKDLGNLIHSELAKVLDRFPDVSMRAVELFAKVSCVKKLFSNTHAIFFCFSTILLLHQTPFHEFRPELNPSQV